jgi:hypothetical protein
VFFKDCGNPGKCVTAKFCIGIQKDKIWVFCMLGTKITLPRSAFGRRIYAQIWDLLLKFLGNSNRFIFRFAIDDYDFILAFKILF